jgi:hypothetical protein
MPSDQPDWGLVLRSELAGVAVIVLFRWALDAAGPRR